MGFLPFHVEQNIEKRKLMCYNMISPHTQSHHIVATLQKKSRDTYQVLLDICLNVMLQNEKQTIIDLPNFKLELIEL